ncbi:MarR family winged helix-turn-helix transcriptional regulator [Phycobacter sp. K97]|uniref:MarR family winged helix-turn-helix transcriptional regulator n=1 Tax=Phycobacter sedimenti TaxID=3133977 RepID=UPI00311E3CD2
MNDLTDDMFLVLPDGRDGSPAAPTLDFNRSPVVTVTFAGNRLTRNAARAYQQEFGVGVMEWRMLVMLTRDPGCSVGHAARTTGIDKAAVSRALQRMEQAGLARAEVLGGDERRKSWFLTGEGHALHSRMLPRALDRQRSLLKGFSPEELAAFAGYLQRFLNNMADDAD